MNGGARVKPSPFFIWVAPCPDLRGFADEIEQDRSKQGRLHKSLKKVRGKYQRPRENATGSDCESRIYKNLIEKERLCRD